MKENSKSILTVIFVAHFIFMINVITVTSPIFYLINLKNKTVPITPWNFISKGTIFKNYYGAEAAEINSRYIMSRMVITTT